MTAADKKKIISNLPFLIFFWIFDKLSYTVRLSGENILISVVKGVSELTKAPLLSFHFTDISIGAIGALAVKGILYLRSKNAEKALNTALLAGARRRILSRTLTRIFTTIFC